VPGKTDTRSCGRILSSRPQRPSKLLEASFVQSPLDRALSRPSAFHCSSSTVLPSPSTSFFVFSSTLPPSTELFSLPPALPPQPSSFSFLEHFHRSRHQPLSLRHPNRRLKSSPAPAPPRSVPKSTTKLPSHCQKSPSREGVNAWNHGNMVS